MSLGMTENNSYFRYCINFFPYSNKDRLSMMVDTNYLSNFGSGCNTIYYKGCHSYMNNYRISKHLG